MGPPIHSASHCMGLRTLRPRSPARVGALLDSQRVALQLDARLHGVLFLQPASSRRSTSAMQSWRGPAARGAVTLTISIHFHRTPNELDPKFFKFASWRTIAGGSGMTLRSLCFQ